MLRLAKIVVCGFLVGMPLLIAAGPACAIEQKGTSMSYGEARDFLAKHTNLVELKNGSGAIVAIAPDWQGRVMTSTCGGNDGPSFGFIHREFIEAGKKDPRFNNYGAEERMWLCPEGGPFSLWFRPGEKQVMENWYTPSALNDGAWNVTSHPNEREVEMAARLMFSNASSTPFVVQVDRRVHLLDNGEFKKLFGQWAAGAVTRPDVKMVAYETENRVKNLGPAMSKDTGLISVWILGMMNAGPKTVILVPYKPGPVSELGPVVKSDYFGPVMPDRLKVANDGIYFLADSKFRSKIGTSQQRARNLLGSIDFEAGVLTLVQFTMPDDPAKCDYMNNMWGLPQANPYTGDVANAYNDGPNDLGKQLGAFYEIESISPALPLKTGDTLVHCHRTVHIKADHKTLTDLAREVLGIDLQHVERAF